MLSGPRKPQRIAVFISGGGSTLQSMLEMHHQLNISLVITNKKNAAGILKARRFGKKIIFFDKSMDYGQLNSILVSHCIDRIILAGFMKILPSDFVETWKNKITNIHPSLLPAYPGLNSAEISWQENSNMGVTLHDVITEMDAGEIVLQQISLMKPKSLILKEALIFLRRTEQFLLRDLIYRYYT